MKVELAVTRSCNHCPTLETELKKLGIPYAVRYAEDDEELQEIQHKKFTEYPGGR